jgi:uncharacterized damage-inducible protein DinB
LVAAQAAALAEQFQHANSEFLDLVEGLSDEQWRSPTAGEGWAIGTVAHHVALSHASIARVVQLVATGQPLPPLTMDRINEGNAQHAAQNPNPDRQETLELARSGGATATDVVRGLSDAQLAQTGHLLGRDWTAGEFAAAVLIGHVRGHTDSIKQATA